MFLEYENERDCLFFLGAGASYSDGVPMQKDILPEILTPNSDELQNSTLRTKVANFITDNFTFSAEKDIYPSLEIIFSYMDYFIENEIALSKKYSIQDIIFLKEAMIKLIYFVTSKSAKSANGSLDLKHDSVYSFFWNRLTKTNRNFSIITCNYDNQIDDAFDRWVYPKYGLIDYCIDFLNYTKEEKLVRYDWWINPREPVPDWTDCDPRPIKLIKIHGSLNWKYCHCCSQPILSPWNSHIDLNTGMLSRSDIGWSEDPEVLNQCPRDEYPLSTMIVPPSHSKVLKHPVIQNLMNEAQKEIRVAKKIVFVGYSFPDADIHIKALFKKNLKQHTEILVINPSLTQSAKYSYSSLSSNLRFIKSGFLEALEDGLIENLLCKTKKSLGIQNLEM